MSLYLIGNAMRAELDLHAQQLAAANGLAEERKAKANDYDRLARLQQQTRVECDALREANVRLQAALAADPLDQSMANEKLLEQVAEARAERDAAHVNWQIAVVENRLVEAERDALKNENSLMAAHQGIDNYQRLLDERDALKESVANLESEIMGRDANQPFIDAMKAENDWLKAAAGVRDAEDQRAIDTLKAELRIKSEFISSRQCGDHNGKWPRGGCFQCEIERLNAIDAAKERT